MSLEARADANAACRAAELSWAEGEENEKADSFGMSLCLGRHAIDYSHQCAGGL